MRRALPLILSLFLATPSLKANESTSTILQAAFTSPQGWRYAEESLLPPHVKLMVVGTANNYFPPSINLAMESFSGTQSDYLEIIKNINRHKKTPMRDLGSLSVDGRNAQLIEIESVTEWGPLKMLQLILVAEGQTYLLTATALKEEFPQYMNLFLETFKTFSIETKKSL